MKRMFKTFAMTLIMTLSIATMAFANTNAIAKLQQNLRALGVSDSYIGATVEYLQKAKVTSAQLDSINAKVNQAKALIGNEKDLSKLDKSVKENLKGLAQETAAVLNLKVSFGKNEMGVTTVTILESNGKAILSLSAEEVTEVILQNSASSVIESIKAAVELLNSNDNKFSPISGTLNQTATNTGNVMVAGVALVAVAGALFVGSRKLFA